LRKIVAFLMQGDALPLLADALPLLADALLLLVDALPLLADALLLLVDALLLQGIGNLIRYELMKCCTKLYLVPAHFPARE
jgi:hypothetical protein